jgi:hypothetical protein
MLWKENSPLMVLPVEAWLWCGLPKLASKISLPVAAELWTTSHYGMRHAVRAAAGGDMQVAGAEKRNVTAGVAGFSPSDSSLPTFIRQFLSGSAIFSMFFLFRSTFAESDRLDISLRMEKSCLGVCRVAKCCKGVFEALTG